MELVLNTNKKAFNKTLTDFCLILDQNDSKVNHLIFLVKKKSCATVLFV